MHAEVLRAELTHQNCYLLPIIAVLVVVCDLDPRVVPGHQDQQLKDCSLLLARKNSPS
jgi:hypothetical protein